MPEGLFVYIRQNETGKKDKIMKKTLTTAYRQRALLCMALPAIVLVIMFSYVPLYGIITAFKGFKFDLGIGGSPWVGLENFRYLVGMGEKSWRIVRNTMGYWAINTVTGTVCNLVLALALNECRKKYFVKVTHTIMIFPTFISFVAITFMAYAILKGNGGLLNQVLEFFGKAPVSWYTEPKYWPVILTVINLWKGAGYGCILYLSALAGMDTEIFEAAEIDGASRMRQIWHISIPQLMSMISIMLIMSVGGIMSSNTGLHYLVTKNIVMLHPTTQTIDSYVMDSLLGTGELNSKFGIQAAITFFQMAIGSTLVIITNVIVRKIEPANSLF